MGVAHLAVPGAHHDVDTIHLVLLELEIVHSAICAAQTEDHFVGVDHELLHLVTQHALRQLAVVHFCHLLKRLRHVLVLPAESRQWQKGVGYKHLVVDPLLPPRLPGVLFSKSGQTMFENLRAIPASWHWQPVVRGLLRVLTLHTPRHTPFLSPSQGYDQRYHLNVLTFFPGLTSRNATSAAV